MLGYCTMTDRRLRPAPERGMLGQLPVYRLEVTSGRWERRRLDQGVKLLRRAGVRRVLAPEDFPYWTRLKEHGLVPPEPWGLLRRLAPQLALAWLDGHGMQPERAAVALRGARAADLTPAALALCPLVGTLVLSAPDGEALARRLRAEFGAAPVEDRRDGGAALALHFAPDLPGGGEKTLSLYPGAPLPEGLVMSAQGLPGGAVCPPELLLAALWEAGRLRPEEVRVDFLPGTGFDRADSP